MDLLTQFEEALNEGIDSFIARVHKNKHGQYVSYDEHKKEPLHNSFRSYVSSLKAVIAPNTRDGTPRLDRFKLASASVRAIMTASVFQLDEEALTREVSHNEPISIFILHPNEALAYAFCVKVLRPFGKRTKNERFSLPEEHGFRYPLNVLHFDENGNHQHFPFDRLFVELLVFYCKCENHFPMLAFANMLNILDVSSDCYQSLNLGKIYYEGT